MTLDLLGTSSIAILIALVLLIIGAVLVGKTPAKPVPKSDDDRSRTAGIVLLVVGCVAVVVSSGFIGFGGKRRFFPKRRSPDDWNGSVGLDF